MPPRHLRDLDLAVDDDRRVEQTAVDQVRQDAQRRRRTTR
jgi:hypothetical protein